MKWGLRGAVGARSRPAGTGAGGQAVARFATRPHRFNRHYAPCPGRMIKREHSHFRRSQRADQLEPHLSGSSRAPASDKRRIAVGPGANLRFYRTGGSASGASLGIPSNTATQTIRWPIQVVDGSYPSFDIELPPEKGDLLDPQLVRAENEKVAAIWGQPETEPAWRGDSGVPSPRNSSPACPLANAARTTVVQ